MMSRLLLTDCTRKPSLFSAVVVARTVAVVAPKAGPKAPGRR